MSTVIRERLHIGDTVYTIDTSPLEAYLASLPVRPASPASPFSENGYVATWAIYNGTPGYPPRTFFDDEIVLEIACGKVARLRAFYLRNVPMHAEDDLNRALPRFLLLARPREDADR